MLIMHEFWVKFLEWLPIITIPFVSGIVGWGTNVLALKMTFYPLDFVGIKPYLGWQGIIPSKAPKMAEISVEMMTEKLISVEEIFSRLEPRRVAEEMEASMEQISTQIIDEIMEAQAPGIWSRMPKASKYIVYQKVLEMLPSIIIRMMIDVKEEINSLLDLKKLAIDTLINDKALINEIFLKVGKEEFKFIEVSGLYYGFLFGLIQMGVFLIYDPWWILPLFGLLVGYATNWLALKVIFNPINPVKFLGFTFQGVFLKRQAEVAKVYAGIIAEKILTTPNLFEYVFRGPTPQKFARIVHSHVDEAIDQIVGELKTYIEAIIGIRRISVVKNIAFYRFMEEMPISFSNVYKYAKKALKIEETLATKMAGLSAEEFVDFLRPVFQEDETKLILVGAVLGFLAGLAQYFLFF